MGKKLEEVGCVKIFLKNLNTQFEETEVISNSEDDDVVDVFFLDKKFQVVHADFGFQKLRETTPEGRIFEMPTRKPKDVWKDFIVNPILKKSKYGKSAKGVTLLIDSYIEPPWLENQIKIAQKAGLDLDLKKFNFEEIYLVCPNKNMRVYPTSDHQKLIE
jgi:hypothetical protein